ncbi:MAG TPA: RagB/SusD family nutrient uptake outer membrane protein [Longimicrobiales bacterium]|nr:RagB/SusD family nutrient uptake outer membrane protein [Longimicrobiales bacterium]
MTKENEMHILTRRGTRWLPGRLALVAAGALALGACDLGVFDPGRIEDADIVDPAAVAPLVAGVEGEFAFAATGQRPGGTFGAVSLITDEIVHSGQYVGMRSWSNGGFIPNDDGETTSRWSYASRARWMAENAIDIITEVLEEEGGNPAADQDIASVTLWAGFSNRLMGETFCGAVINGGGLEPTEAFFSRAEGYFTDAISVASSVGNDSLVTAAHAGRAQVRVMLGDWSGAVADAGQVPTDYVHEVRHSDNSSREYNGLHELHLRDTQASVWGTPFAEWGTIVNRDEVEPYRAQLDGLPDPEGDPRVPYTVPIEVVEGQASYVEGGDQRRPNWEPYKYPARETNTAVAKGTEMRLIEAEAALLDGSVGDAVDLINEVRAHHGLGAVSAATVDEGWALLMKERGIELWLEGRRAADLRRWAETPGSVPLEVVRLETGGGAPPSDDERRNVLEFLDQNGNVLPQGEGICLPVSANEINANPNL